MRIELKDEKSGRTAEIGMRTTSVTNTRPIGRRKKT